MSLAVALVVLAAMAALVLALMAGKRRVAVLIGLVGVALVAVLGAVHPTSIVGYREIDDYNLELEVTGAAPVWREVTQLTETGSTITVGLSEVPSFQLGAGFGDERMTTIVVRLHDPLADRQVIDASTGAVIPMIRTAQSIDRATSDAADSGASDIHQR